MRRGGGRCREGREVGKEGGREGWREGEVRRRGWERGEEEDVGREERGGWRRDGGREMKGNCKAAVH